VPKPRKNETEANFMKRCVPKLIEEGREQDQAVAICLTMWSDGKKPKK
jgi:hypothetical protein